ncbi:MAG: D-alanine--D-alanine ligase, partial [Planctomycetota bacterium]
HSEGEINRWKMEHDVLAALESLGHEIRSVGVEDDLKPVREALNEFRPHVVFNMLMHFHDAGIYDSAVVAWLELRKQPYTGCNPRGLFVAGDKALSKKVMSYHRIRSPRFLTVPPGKRIRSLPKGLEFPLFVKSRSEHASTGIAQASIVHDVDKLQERVEFIHRNVGTGALCEEFIEGRELTIGVMGNDRLSAGPVWETFMEKLPDGTPNIYTSKMKWDRAYQRKVGLRTGPADALPEGMEERITKMAKRLYRALGLSGFARIDLRMDARDRLFVLEANPNPDLCFGEDFAEGFDQFGTPYPKLIQKILNLGLRYEAPWMA